jgi:hypothetical protein
MTMTDEEWSRRIDQGRAELDARYERINRMWTDAGIPALVRPTPDWQSGWVFGDWVDRHWAQAWDHSQPPLGATWAREVHIWSHWLHTEGGHSMRHAAIEEVGARLVLEWWNARA